MKDDKHIANTRLGPGPDSENKNIRSSYIPAIGKNNRAEERRVATRTRVAAKKRLDKTRSDNKAAAANNAAFRKAYNAKKTSSMGGGLAEHVVGG